MRLRICNPAERPITACVYLLIDPRDEVVRYVGSCTEPYSRYRYHVTDAMRATHPTPKEAWIRELVQLGQFPILEVQEVVAASSCHEQEQHFYHKHAQTIFNKQLPGQHPTRTQAYRRRHFPELQESSK